MQLHRKEMLSGKRCLAISLLCCFCFCLSAQEPQYYYGFGETIDDAKDDLVENILNKEVKVARHSVLKDKNGKQEYDSYTGVDSGISIPWEEIELSREEDFWLARIEKAKVLFTGSEWKVENITISNTYNETPYYSRGFRRTRSTIKTNGKVTIIGPSGRVVKTIPGKEKTIVEDKAWNGRYGWTYRRKK